MNKKIWLAIAIAVVVAVVYMWTGKGPSFVSDQSANPSPSPSSSPTQQTAKSSVKKTGDTAPSSTKTYSELVKEYEGRRIQFDDRCQVLPLNPVYKNGTSIMLDNRANTARVIKIGSTSYSLSSLGYKVVTLNSSSLPQELSVTCGSSGNVGKILLQAMISQ